MENSMAITIPGLKRTALAAAIATLVVAPAAFGAEYDVGDGKLKVTGSVYVGVTQRTDLQDRSLVPNVNGAQVGIAGASVSATAGRNQDDGNLNFNRGDLAAEVVKGYLTLDYSVGNYGVVGSVKAWYDYLLENRSMPWGNIPNGYKGGEPLSDSGAIAQSKFSGIVLDNLYVHGSNQLDTVSLDWILGNQKLDWGNRYLVLGGLRDLNPLDIPATLRPGVDRQNETRIAFPAAFARVGITKDTRVEGFYQFVFQRNAPNECGTFYSQLDYVSEGCNAVFLAQNQSDRALLTAGTYLKRAETKDPSNSGQLGIALKHNVAEWATDFGVYATQFHSRASFYSAIKGQRTGAPFLPGDPGGLNPKYFTEYPEDIQMYGLSFDTKFKGGAVFGEFTYRPNQPLQYNSSDLIAAFTSLTAPTLLRARATATAPGAAFEGWERHTNVQLQLGANAIFPNVLGAAGMNLGAELVYKGVPDLPDPTVVRFGRADVFGQGPVNGVCPPPAAPTACSLDGYVSKNAWGYRARAGLRYPEVAPGLDIVPSIAFGQDVSGWSGDGSILEGRVLMVATLQATYAKNWTAGISWLPTWGGTYNNLRDRSAAQAWVGYQF
jgi:hypothetical protein